VRVLDPDALALRRLGERLDDALGLVEVPVLAAVRAAEHAVGREPRDERF
jgi:hypothetical protein